MVTFAIVSTILEADDSGTLHLPPSVLPHPGPHRRYRVAAEGGQVVVDEAKPEPPTKDHEDHQAWLGRLEKIRARGATGKAGMPLQQIFDEIRADRR
jgi:hypothetical protein